MIAGLGNSSSKPSTDPELQEHKRRPLTTYCKLQFSGQTFLVPETANQPPQARGPPVAAVVGQVIQYWEVVNSSVPGVPSAFRFQRLTWASRRDASSSTRITRRGKGGRSVSGLRPRPKPCKIGIRGRVHTDEARAVWHRKPGKAASVSMKLKERGSMASILASRTTPWPRLLHRRVGLCIRSGLCGCSEWRGEIVK
jgi:hypothetical protein